TCCWRDRRSVTWYRRYLFCWCLWQSACRSACGFSGNPTILHGARGAWCIIESLQERRGARLPLLFSSKNPPPKTHDPDRRAAACVRRLSLFGDRFTECVEYAEKGHNRLDAVVLVIPDFRMP